MQPIEFTIDGHPATTDVLPVSVRDMLRLASEASDSDKHDRVLIDPDGNSLFLGSLMVRPQPGSKWRTRA
jgi:hypothetical protein